MTNIGVLISGRGSNFEAIARNVAASVIPARISLVVSNRPDARGLDLARKMGLNARYIPSQGRTREEFEHDLLAALAEKQVDVICLAGFMRVLSADFVRRFPQRILNIHPSLLPAFPGIDAQKQALEYGVKFTGCTVHFVDETVDAGPVILQAVVTIEDGDTVETLSERILREEHRIYTQALRIVLEERYRIEGRRVLISPEKN